MKKLANNKPGTQKGLHRPDRIENYTVAEETTLLPFLLASMPDRNRTTVKNLLHNRQVAVDNIPITQFDHPLHPGGVVSINLARPFNTFRHPRMKLLWEDDDILVVEKGYGLLSMATDRKGEETAYSILRDYVKWADPKNKVFIVHRLDRDTSGIMMFAKNLDAKEAMQHNWNNMVLQRTYVAVVRGTIEEDEGVIRSYLGENAQHEVFSTPEPRPGAQLAVTRWRVIRRGKGNTMLEVSLDTGRKNQIRVHMKDLGHPIVGDRRYGGGTSPIHRLALHARDLSFVHPATRKRCDFNAEIPSTFFRIV